MIEVNSIKTGGVCRRRSHIEYRQSVILDCYVVCSPPFSLSLSLSLSLSPFSVPSLCPPLSPSVSVSLHSPVLSLPLSILKVHVNVRHYKVSMTRNKYIQKTTNKKILIEGMYVSNSFLAAIHPVWMKIVRWSEILSNVRFQISSQNAHRKGK